MGLSLSTNHAINPGNCFNPNLQMRYYNLLLARELISEGVYEKLSSFLSVC